MNNKRKLTALTIWWCEGTKLRKDKRWKNGVNCPIEITNTDPRLIKIFLDFLRKDLRVENKKIRGRIQIHEGDDQANLEEFWSKITMIPLSQFNKTIVRKKGNKIGKTNGTFTIRMYDKILFNKIKQLLDEEVNSINFGE